ncbi:MAG TPA: MFS transporter [Jiangellaceae bacterium]|nr:MFS transporter [Jiangellaceae bacterium]
MASDPTQEPATQHEPSKGTLRRAITASALGNATEWYDYGIFAVLVLYIESALFPEGENAIGWVLAAFAVSFLARPFGGLVWGPLGDRIGRRAVLSLTIIMMSVATFCIGLIPTFDAIGVGAPALLFFMRLVQGFSTGGEYGGAATFMAEYSPDRKRGFYGSFLEFGTLGGYALGSLIALGLLVLLGEDTMYAWGWRLPFLVAGPMGLIGFYLRLKLEDTPVFREAEEKSLKEDKARTQFKDLVVGYWPQMAQLFGLVVALNVINYTLLAYMPTYVQEEINMGAREALVLVSVGQLVMMAFVPFCGSLSDRIGRKPMWYASLIGMIVLAIPMYTLMAQGFIWAVVAFIVLGLVYVLQLSTISSTFPALFPTPVRFAGFAITYNVATSLLGGTAPNVNNFFIGETGNNIFPAYYMMASCVVGLIAIYFVTETAGKSIRGSYCPGTPESERELAEMAKE